MQGVRAAAGASQPDFWEGSGRCGEGKQSLEGCRAAALPTLSLLVPFPLHSQAHVLDDAPLSAATATVVPKGAARTRHGGGISATWRHLALA